MSLNPSREAYPDQWVRIACRDCGGLETRWMTAKRCMACMAAADGIKGRAHNLVHKAVKEGALRPVTECVCVDCGAPAKAYDHRDYDSPLDVVPVCISCNYKRGLGVIAQHHTRWPWPKA